VTDARRGYGTGAVHMSSRRDRNADRIPQINPHTYQYSVSIQSNWFRDVFLFTWIRQLNSEQTPFGSCIITSLHTMANDQSLRISAARPFAIPHLTSLLRHLKAARAHGNVFSASPGRLANPLSIPPFDSRPPPLDEHVPNQPCALHNTFPFTRACQEQDWGLPIP